MWHCISVSAQNHRHSLIPGFTSTTQQNSIQNCLCKGSNLPLKTEYFITCLQDVHKTRWHMQIYIYLIPHRKKTWLWGLFLLFSMFLMALQKAIFVSFHFILYTGLNWVPPQNNVLLVLDKCQIRSYTATKTPEHTTVYLFFSFPPWTWVALQHGCIAMLSPTQSMFKTSLYTMTASSQWPSRDGWMSFLHRGGTYQ